MNWNGLIFNQNIGLFKNFFAQIVVYQNAETQTQVAIKAVVDKNIFAAWIGKYSPCVGLFLLDNGTCQEPFFGVENDRIYLEIEV